MTILIRPFRENDLQKFSEWYSVQPNRIQNIFHFPETYALCAFRKDKIVAFLVVRLVDTAQILATLTCNPAATDLEKALASKELVKQVVMIGHLKNLPEIYFLGDVVGTNRIAEHFFSRVSGEKIDKLFGEVEYPVYGLTLEDLE